MTDMTHSTGSLHISSNRENSRKMRHKCHPSSLGLCPILPQGDPAPETPTTPTPGCITTFFQCSCQRLLGDWRLSHLRTPARICLVEGFTADFGLVPQHTTVLDKGGNDIHLSPILPRSPLDRCGRF